MLRVTYVAHFEILRFKHSGYIYIRCIYVCIHIYIYIYVYIYTNAAQKYIAHFEILRKNSIFIIYIYTYIYVINIIQ